MSAYYFHIDQGHIKLTENAIYPFHLSVYSYQNGVYHLFLSANSPLTSEKLTFLQSIMDKGAKLAINTKQKETYLDHQQLDANDIPSLQESPISQMAHRSFDLAKKLEEKDQKEGSYDYAEKINEAIQSTNFLPLIERTREEAMTFSFRTSHTVSLANYFSENFLHQDHIGNRVVALSYLCAKSLGIDDEQSLGDLITASFLYHIGYTQMDLDLARKPQQDYKTKEQSSFKKHPGLTQHLIRKSGLMISERCNKIMYQHHERFDGSGFPEYKQGQHIEPMALILAVASHFIEFSSGKITGKETQIKQVLQSFRDRSPSSGLEFNFGDQIHDLVENLLRPKISNEEKKAA
jgi:response regulator RpfG family c-di-GMP phosphodiesterase